MIYHGTKSVTTAGIAVPLSATRVPLSWITFFPLQSLAHVANAGQIRIGGKPDISENGGTPGVTTGIPSGSGMPLNPGDSGVAWPMMAPQPLDLSTIYLDSDVSADGVQFVYARP